MKLDEIILEKQKLDEIPAGGLGQMAKKVGSRVLNKVPGAAAKSKAANLAGQADLGDTANNLHKEFNQYLGTQGKKIAQASGEDLAAFLKTKNHKTAAKIPSGVLQKTQLDQVLMTVSKEALAGQGGTGTAPAADAAQGQTDANNDGKDDKTGEPVAKSDTKGSEQKIEFVPNQEVLFVSKAGKTLSAKVVGKSQDGDDSKVSVQGAKGQSFNIPREKLLDPKTKKPFKPGQKPSATPAADTQIPAELQQKIDALSPEEKKKLAELL